MYRGTGTTPLLLSREHTLVARLHLLPPLVAASEKLLLDGTLAYQFHSSSRTSNMAFAHRSFTLCNTGEKDGTKAARADRRIDLCLTNELARPRRCPLCHKRFGNHATEEFLH